MVESHRRKVVEHTSKQLQRHQGTDEKQRTVLFNDREISSTANLSYYIDH